MTANPTKDEIAQFVRLTAPGYGLDPERILKQVETESSYNQAAVSSCGARGLMQLTAIAVKDVAQRCGLQADPADWRQNLMCGMALMALLYHQYAGAYDKALAAYNCGAGTLRQVMAEHPDNWREHLPAETAGYLAKNLGPWERKQGWRRGVHARAEALRTCGGVHLPQRRRGRRGKRGEDGRAKSFEGAERSGGEGGCGGVWRVCGGLFYCVLRGFSASLR